MGNGDVPGVRGRGFRAVGAMLVVLLWCAAAAAGDGAYKISFERFREHKDFFDDPRPVVQDLGWDTLMPPQEYRALVYDREKMAALWKQAVGFAAPGVVGIVAPEITPGTYTCADRDKLPGLQQLMSPAMYARFRPAGPPHCGAFSKLDVVPTRAYWYSLPVAAATARNRGTATLNRDGYLDEQTYRGGLPFPAPAGAHRAWQIVYNWVKGCRGAESFFHTAWSKSFDAHLRQDFDLRFSGSLLRLHARVEMPPLGWFDAGARERGEAWAIGSSCSAPRDMYGNINTAMMFLAWDRDMQFMVYLASLRRACRQSGSALHDQVIGMDGIYEDSYLWSQKITPLRNPYTCAVVAEREMLWPSYTTDGREYLRSGTLQWCALRFERRPCYVLELVQQDPSYIYSRRVLYVDRETFLILEMENYDQAGRLYHTQTPVYAWHPDSGAFQLFQVLQCDHVEAHSTFLLTYGHPAPWMQRDDISLQTLITRGK